MLDDDYRIEHYTRFMGNFLDQLGIKHAVLVGNSLGGRGSSKSPALGGWRWQVSRRSPFVLCELDDIAAE
jgi:pimeloyl-ACP methyl ester carboxylesterase